MYTRNTVLAFLAVTLIFLGCASESEKNARIWLSEGQTPDAYSSAAAALLADAFSDGADPMTLGNVAIVLGKPSSMRMTGYRLKSYQAIDDSAQLEIAYTKKGTVITFSTAGVAKSLLAKNNQLLSSVAEWQTPLNFAQFGATSKATGIFDSSTKLDKLKKAAEEFSAKCEMEAHWYRLMRSRTTQDPPELQQACKATVFLIDGVRTDLARVGFVVKGEHRLVYHSWWTKSGATWTRVTRRTAFASIVKGKSVADARKSAIQSASQTVPSGKSGKALFAGISRPPPIDAGVVGTATQSKHDKMLEEILALERDADFVRAFKRAREVRSEFVGSPEVSLLDDITQRLVKEKRLNVGLADVVAKLGSADESMRDFLMDELSEGEEAGLVHLRKAVRDAKPSVANAAAELLVELRDRASGYSFAGRLKRNPGDPLRTTLANGLRVLKATGAAKSLSQLVKSSQNAELSALAMSIMSDLDEADPDMVPSLYRAVWEEKKLFDKRPLVGYLCSTFENVCNSDKDKFNKLAQHDDAYRFIATYVVAGMKDKDKKVRKWAYGYCDLFGLLINSKDLIVHLRGNGKLTKGSNGDVTKWIDESKRSNDADQKTESQRPTFVHGMSGEKSYIRFDGKDDRIVVSSVKDRSEDSFTLSAWIYLENDASDTTNPVSPNQCIVAETSIGGGASSFMLLKKGDLLVFTIYSWEGHEKSLKTATKLKMGEWIHVGGTFGNSQMGIYINGVCEGIARCFKARKGGKHSLVIGAGGSDLDSTPFRGRIASISLYNVALKEKVVRVVANANQPRRSRD